MFFGHFPRKLNSKKQVPVPSRLRQVVPEEDRKNGFWLVVSNHGCLYLFTHGEVAEKIKQAVVSLPTADRRAATMRIMPVDMDRQGRILLVADFREAAGIKEEVTFVGNADRIEIWDPKRLDKAEKARDAKSRQRIEEVMQEIFE